MIVRCYVNRVALFEYNLQSKTRPRLIKDVERTAYSKNRKEFLSQSRTKAYLCSDNLLCWKSEISPLNCCCVEEEYEKGSSNLQVI